MKKEQYTRAISIYHRIRDLETIKNDIEKYSKKLTYVNDEGRELNHYRFQNISEILDKHDLMIRSEIDAEIESLKMEIETL